MSIPDLSNAAMPEVKLISNAAMLARKPDKMTVDRLASHIVTKLELHGYEKFVCKTIYWLGIPKVSDIADRATSPNVRSPARFFTSVCKREMQI